MTGLVEAADRYDSTYGVAFSTFAYHRIAGAVYDGLRRMGQLPRSLYAKMRASELVGNAVDRRAGAAGAPASARANLGEVLRVVQGVATATVRAHAAAGAAGELAAPAADEIGDPLLRERMRAAIADLPERERHFIEKHYFEDKSLVDAGAELGVSKSWASRLHARAIELLRKKLASER